MTSRARAGHSALLLTNGTHAPRGNNQALLEDVFGRQAGLEVHVCPDPAAVTPERLATVGVILDYSGNPDVGPNDDQLSVILDAVEGGKPYIGLHVAALPFVGQRPFVHRGERVYTRTVDGFAPLWRQRPEARDRAIALPASPAPSATLSEMQRRHLTMLGCAFISHPPVKRFTVRILAPEHPITRGLVDFEIEDELYELGGDLSKLDVLAEAEGQPLIYATRWGEGKVHYNALGHDYRALANPTLQRLLVQAAGWALDAA